MEIILNEEQQMEIMNFFQNIKKNKVIKITLANKQLDFILINPDFVAKKSIIIDTNINENFDFYISFENLESLKKNKIKKLTLDKKTMLVILDNNSKIQAFSNKNELNFDINEFFVITNTHYTLCLNVQKLKELLNFIDNNDNLYFHIDLFNPIAPILINNNNLQIAMKKEKLNNNQYLSINNELFNLFFRKE